MHNDTFIAIGPISAVTVQYAIRLCNSVNIWFCGSTEQWNSTNFCVHELNWIQILWHAKKTWHCDIFALLPGSSLSGSCSTGTVSTSFPSDTSGSFGLDSSLSQVRVTFSIFSTTGPFGGLTSRVWEQLQLWDLLPLHLVCCLGSFWAFRCSIKMSSTCS